MENRLETVELEGVHGRFRAFPDDLITRQIREFGAHTRNEIAMVLDHLVPGDVCVDLGAHIGTFAIAMARRVGEYGKVLAVEGNTDTLQLLQHNVEENGLGARVVTERAIAGDGRARKLARHDVSGNSGAGYYAPSDDAEMLPTEDVAALLSRRGFAEPDFIKMDIEGMEAIALRNLLPILQARRPILYVEIAADQLSRFGDTPGMVEVLLKELGYRFYRNGGQRNSSNDSYRLIELDSLTSQDRLFDLLALPERR